MLYIITIIITIMITQVNNILQKITKEPTMKSEREFLKR